MRRAHRVVITICLAAASLLMLGLALGMVSGWKRVSAEGPGIYKGLDILFLVDQSGSMGGRDTGSSTHPVPNDPLGLRFFAPQHFVSLLGADRLQAHPDATFRVAAIHFGDAPQVGMDWQVIAPASWEEWDAKEAEFKNTLLAPGELETTNLGNTDFLEAFDTAHEVFQSLPKDQPEPRHRLIIVLTDGQPCVPPSSPVVTETVSPEMPTPTPLPPCLPVWEHMRDLATFVDQNLPAPEYTIYLVAMNDNEYPWWEPIEKYWQDITNGRAGKVVRNRGEVAKRFREILLEMVEDLPPKTEVLDTFIVPGPVAVEPYLESIEFTYYKEEEDERLLVYDQNGVLLDPEMPNVAVQGADRIVETVIVYQPQPGMWQLETTSKSEEVDIARRQVRARGVLRSPVGSQIQYIPVSIEWRLEDSRGAALPDYSHPRYRLQAEATIVAGDESWPLQLLSEGNGTYAATFAPVVEGTHTIVMKALSQDINGTPIEVFDGEVGNFEVGPVVIVPRNMPVAHAQFSPLTLEYELQDTGGRPVGIQSPMLISATLSALDQQWPLFLQAGSDGIFTGEFVPLAPGVHSVQMVATLQVPSGETLVLSEQEGGAFNVVRPAVTLRSPVGAQAQYLPMTVSFDATDGSGNPFVTAPGYQAQFVATLRTEGQVESLALLPSSSTTYSGVFTPTVAGVYDLEARGYVVDLVGDEHEFYRSKTPVNVVPTTKLDFQVTKPSSMVQEIRTLFFKPVPLILEVQLEREDGGETRPDQLLASTDEVFTVQVYDDRREDRSADLALKPTGVPSVYRAESDAFERGRFEITVEAVAEPRAGYIWARRSQTLVVERIENRIIRLAEFVVPGLVAAAVAGLLLRRRHINRVTAHPCRGTLYIQDAYGKTLKPLTLGGRNRIVFKRKDLHPSAHLSRLEVVCRTEKESKDKIVYITAVSDKGVPVIRNELFRPGTRRQLGAHRVYLVKDLGARME